MSRIAVVITMFLSSVENGRIHLDIGAVTER
jgi:hypothetical protein